MEVHGAEAVLLVDRGQGEAEHAVSPLEVDTGHVVVAGQRVEVEEVVLDAVRRVLLPRVHHQTVAAQVGDVGVGIITSLSGRIHHLRNEREVNTLAPAAAHRPVCEIFTNALS